MKVRGSKPDGLCMVERHPQRPEMAIVRLFANPAEYEESQNGMTAKGWEYEEYRLEVPYYDSLVADVNAAYEGWLAQAKAAEDAKDPMAKLMAAQDSTDALVVDQEYRLTLLELGMTAEAE
jgi:hypothetical protein